MRADSGIGGDEPALVEEFDQPHCKDTHEGRADNEKRRVQAADGKESENDAEEEVWREHQSAWTCAGRTRKFPGRRRRLT